MTYESMTIEIFKKIFKNFYFLFDKPVRLVEVKLELEFSPIGLFRFCSYFVEFEVKKKK